MGRRIEPKLIVSAAIGQKRGHSFSPVCISGQVLPWIDQFKFLDVGYNAHRDLIVYVSSVERILSGFCGTVEPVEVQLFKSFCLAYLCLLIA
jgi:hypothetical protein